MRLIFLLICLCPLLSSAQIIIPVNGGGDPIIIPRDPFFVYQFYPSAFFENCDNLFLNITYPINGSNFYFPNISPNVTFVLTNSMNPVCMYRLNVLDTWYEWNSWENCGNSDELINNKIITLPEGYPAMLEVMVLDGSCSISDIKSVSVYYFAPQSKYNNVDWFVLAYFGIGFVIILYASYNQGLLDEY